LRATHIPTELIIPNSCRKLTFKQVVFIQMSSNETRSVSHLKYAYETIAWDNQLSANMRQNWQWHIQLLGTPAGWDTKTLPCLKCVLPCETLESCFSNEFLQAFQSHPVIIKHGSNLKASIEANLLIFLAQVNLYCYILRFLEWVLKLGQSLLNLKTWSPGNTFFFFKCGFSYTGFHCHKGQFVNSGDNLPFTAHTQ
jgi:hypothetical protein